MIQSIIEFCATDGAMLNGWTNGKTSDKVIIQIHGMTSNCFKKREKIIAQELQSINVDTLCINTRGSGIVRYLKYNTGKKVLAGTGYEDVEESYLDILGAIKYALKLGYTSIYLQGHSLGATKVVYTYNKLKNENNDVIKYIKGILLLSLVDLPKMFAKEYSRDTLAYALEKEKNNELSSLMPESQSPYPMTVKTFLRYAKYNENINFAKFDEENYTYPELNNIQIPLFIRWGNVNEIINKDAREIVDIVNSKLINTNKDIGYIDGANHTYENCEEELANQIRKFIKQI